MNMQITSRNGIQVVPIDTTLLSKRRIFIEDEITHKNAVQLVKRIMSFSDSRECIDIYINSIGGDIDAGLLIYDMIISCPFEIRTFCLGRAYSMAAVIFAAAKKGNRFIFPHSKLLLHEPILGNQVSGNASSIKSISETLMQSRERLNKILEKHTGKSIEEIEAATSYDHYFNAQESIDFGLADKIIGFDSVL